MAFSNTSFFAGIGTAFAAIVVGFAGGATFMKDTIQPPNRLERLTSSAPIPSDSATNPATTPTKQEQSIAVQPPAPQAPLAFCQRPPRVTRDPLQHFRRPAVAPCPQSSAPKRPRSQALAQCA